MAKVYDYASLTQAIADFSHRADLIAGSSPYSDYFIQGAQDAIQNDLFDLNFGNGIAFQEAPYGPYTITNGVTPVPGDWVSPKLMTVADGAGDESLLAFKAAAWIYDNYALRNSAGIPAFIARDTGYVVPSQVLTCASGQTVFALTGSPTVALVSLEGVSLVPAVDYTISGNLLSLTSGSVQGQALAVTSPSLTGYQNASATSGQTVFSLTAAPVLVTLGGVVLYPALDYTLAGSTLTLLHGAILNQVLTAYYGSGYASQTYSASAGQSEFSINENAAIALVALDGVTLYAGTDYTVNGSTLTLEGETLSGQKMFILYGGNTSNSVFIFGPYPDSPYTVQGTYYQGEPSLSSTLTTNWLVTDAPLVMHAACMVEAGKFVKDVQMVQGWTQIYQQRLKALVDRDKAERWGASTMQVNTG